MPSEENKELDRKYRVLRQTLGIHFDLADCLTRRTMAVEAILLICSVIFCATTFATDDLYRFLGLSATSGKVALGIASVAAFAASLVLLLVDWKRKSEQHRQAACRWSDVLALYRDALQPDGTWNSEDIDSLHRAYWDADKNTVSIPAGARFTKLKSSYLIRVEISKKKSKYPGCPRFVLWLILRFSDTYRALRDAAIMDEGIQHEETQNASQEDVAG